MITYFYKILYDRTDVVYVGVTTTSVHRRFSQHRISKNLNNRYSAIEFYRIEHPIIDSIENIMKNEKSLYFRKTIYKRREKQRI